MGRGRVADLSGAHPSIERTVSLLERDGQAASAVTLARSFATTVEDLWDAVTSGERIPRWFLPISGEFRLGGCYQLEDNAGGEITACEPHAHFAVTWEFGGDVSWVEVRVSDEGAGHARLTLTHTAHLSEHWDEYGPGATGVGWEMGLLGLALHLAAPEGKAFMTDSSEAWGHAAVAAGADPDAAQAAAKRTTAFYTGAPADPD